ncbi:MAG: hypothetical protein ACRC45_00555 [Cetobacterium sp.]
MEVASVKFITTTKVRVFFLEGDPSDYKYRKSTKGNLLDVNGINHILFRENGAWHIIEEDLYEARI